jgi:hypothetical protein
LFVSTKRKIDDISMVASRLHNIRLVTNVNLMITSNVILFVSTKRKIDDISMVASRLHNIRLVTNVNLMFT